ncbi:helix-turn-helix domain-containing protein [Streptomyces mobaraensis]|uniref:Helix-turn-helix transcriptional regulator n=1 Tax=Streptomyces mobaraensis TaxID=35621 RepID=A0A5N5W457_STRMB|nr:helix-turn-helix transcriptional regulator [Streptomyces mobaraensis]KAB7839487.1 helix-turn-helix transcriptional regulator [Streptomyces mobaraensis]
MSPERTFDARKFRAARRAADRTQAQVGNAVGVNEAAVAKWEREMTTPPSEKLAALAAYLGAPIDKLFPRTGPATLADLRRDAGLTQQDAARVIGTRSSVPVRKAEGGKRRLADVYVPLLASAYGVTIAQLLAAQERSFRVDVPDPGASGDRPGTVAAPEAPAINPRSLAERIAFLLESSDARLDTTDAGLAVRGNMKVGRQVLTADLVAAMRSGNHAGGASEALEALAMALDAPPAFLTSDDESVHRVVSAARLLTSGVSGMAARGDGEALTPQMLDFINDTVAKIQSGLPKDQGSGRRPE